MIDNVWNITKSIALVSVVLLVWFYGNGILKGMNQPSTVPPEVLKQLAANQLALQNIQADSKAAKQLIADLKEQNGQQKAFIERIEKENREKGAKLDEIGVVMAKMKQSVDLKNRDSDKSYSRDDKKKVHSYEFKKIYAKDAEGKPFPVAWVMYYPYQTPDKKWKSGTYPMEYHTTIIESQNKDGSFDRAAEFHIENNRNKETRGHEYPIQMTGIQWEKFELSDKRFYWWNPRVAFGAAFTNTDISPNLNLSLSSYGVTERDMDWRLFTFGLGVSAASEDTNFNFIFEPFSWNVGNALPLVENLFTGPVISVDQEAEYSFGVQLSIPF